MLGIFAANSVMRSTGLGIATVAGIGYGIHSKLKGAMTTPGNFSNAINPQIGNVQGYGKRGTNSNRLNTDGLVQGLHGNRRR